MKYIVLKEERVIKGVPRRNGEIVAVSDDYDEGDYKVIKQVSKTEAAQKKHRLKAVMVKQKVLDVERKEKRKKLEKKVEDKFKKRRLKIEEGEDVNQPMADETIDEEGDEESDEESETLKPSIENN